MIVTGTSLTRSKRCMRRHSFTSFALLQKRSGLTDLALAGGCAMNSVANGKVRRKRHSGASMSRRRPAMPAARSARPLRVWHRLGGKRYIRDGPRLLGASSSMRRGHRQAVLAAQPSDRGGRLHQSRSIPTRTSSAGAPPTPSRTARSSDGSRGGWNGVHARSATDRLFAIRAAPT